MRWKERFLVPDHCVENINGASFAGMSLGETQPESRALSGPLGFYYVCVDFNPPPATTRATTQQMPETPEDDVDENDWTPSKIRTRRGSSIRAAESTNKPLAPSVATMTGYYHHKNSDPFQKLTLEHVPARFSQKFEFR
jgi:hypothetical protein